MTSVRASFTAAALAAVDLALMPVIGDGPALIALAVGGPLAAVRICRAMLREFRG